LSKLGCTELFFFVQPGVKVNSDYYPEGEAAAMHQGNIQ